MLSFSLKSLKLRKCARLEIVSAALTTENAIAPTINLQFQNADTFRHQGDSAAIFMLRTAFFVRFIKKIYVDVLAHCGMWRGAKKI